LTITASPDQPRSYTKRRRGLAGARLTGLWPDRVEAGEDRALSGGLRQLGPRSRARAVGLAVLPAREGCAVQAARRLDAIVVHRKSEIAVNRRRVRASLVASAPRQSATGGRTPPM